MALWGTGFFFEAVGDWQMAQFKKDPGNKGKVMDRGLWKYTRHPNYFGDTCIWWGFFLFGLGHPQGWWFVFSPILMTFLLVRVSGAAMLEEGMVEKKPGYQAYIEKTSGFFPWAPKEK
jgi:steroid 5-alpha reductase family enzyme